MSLNDLLSTLTSCDRKAEIYSFGVKVCISSLKLSIFYEVLFTIIHINKYN